jgi:transposase-like protein
MFKRKQYTPQFKFDRALEAIKTDNLSEISRKYGVSVNVLSNWRSELIKRGAQMFATTPDQENNRLKAKIAKLERMLGKKEVELNVLKNFSDFYESENTT